LRPCRVGKEQVLLQVALDGIKLGVDAGNLQFQRLKTVGQQTVEAEGVAFGRAECRAFVVARVMQQGLSGERGLGGHRLGALDSFPGTFST
jgi:hypothetical protein